MKRIIVGAMIGAAVSLSTTAAPAQTNPFPTMKCEAQSPTFDNVRLPHAVLVNGATLPAGTYTVRVTNERPEPAPGQTAASACWVEFVTAGAVAGREVASVIPPNELADVAKGPPPKAKASRVDQLKGGDYIRVWLNADGTHYIVNLPIAP
jgi:hypothetical protein